MPSSKIPARSTIQKVLSKINMGNFGSAKQQAKEYLKRNPNDYIMWNLYGILLSNTGQSKAAKQAFERSLQINSEFSDALTNLGLLIHNAGNLEKAKSLYTRAISIDNNYSAHNNLAKIYLDNGDEDNALQHLEKSLFENKNQTGIYVQLAKIYIKKNNLPHAIKLLETELLNSPENIDAYINLGCTLVNMKKNNKALQYFRRALSMNPRSEDAIYNTAIALQGLKEYDEALSLFLDIPYGSPFKIHALNNAGMIYVNQKKYECAINMFQEALHVDTSFAKAIENLATCYKYQGEHQKAVKLYQKAINLRPREAKTYKAATAMKQFPINGELLKDLRQIFKDSSPDSKNQRDACFALFNIYDRLKNHAQAYRWLQTGNRIRKNEISHHFNRDKELFERSMQLIASTEHVHCERSNSQIPIFIVGMPRSGTTLLEQILSTHTLIYGTGELPTLGKLAAQVATLDNIKKSDIEKVRDEYLRDVYRINKDHTMFTDKMPHNFLYLPLIFSAFPEAKVIHIHRSPQATCWSNFRIDFAGDFYSYSYDLESLVAHYNMYVELMTQYSRYYKEKIFHLSYESLVKCPRTMISKIIEFLNIEWEDNLLHPERNKKAISTASNEQARQPIYQSSSDEWLCYERYVIDHFNKLKKFDPIN